MLPPHPNVLTSLRVREWALLIPAWSVVVVLLTYFVYWALALYATPAFDDMKAIAGMQHICRSTTHHKTIPLLDSRTNLPRAGALNPYEQSAKDNAIPELYDIPIGLVNRVLYGGSGARR